MTLNQQGHKKMSFKHKHRPITDDRLVLTTKETARLLGMQNKLYVSGLYMKMAQLILLDMDVLFAGVRQKSINLPG